jgi:cysteine synthase
MKINNDVVEAIGNTPMIKLKRASEQTGCTILGKAEFMNPGQSVKDRAGKQMILEAEKRGDLKPGGLVLEGTAGNTGIGLAVVANARGYRTLIVIPQTQSQEKKDALRLCGAELVEVPALPYSNPNNYQHVAKRLADQLRKNEPNGVLFADQWNNLDNAKAHYVSTGPEIWEQTGGKVDAERWRAPAPSCAKETKTWSSGSPIPAARPCTNGSSMARSKPRPVDRSPKESVSDA